MSKIIVTFVGKSKYQETSVMHSAFDRSRLEFNLDPKWITVNECLRIDKSKLLKTDVFILEEFSGPAFDHLLNSKALIIGTRCLLECLSQAQELPPWTHPIYSLAMGGMQVTSSGIKLNERDKMQQYIEWMGGVYDKLLHKKTTHLIANNVTSVKYSKAAGNIPIMRPEWIEAIWQASIRDTVIGDCSKFLLNSLESYRLKPFHGLHITSASLSKTDREQVKNCVESNGGTYMGNYKGDLTDVVVTTEVGVTSAKYKAARAAAKECVTPEWIFDSGSAGYAKSMDAYRIGARSSTPTKSDALQTLERNFSMMSALNESANQSAVISVNESMSATGVNSFTSFTKPVNVEDKTLTPGSKNSIKNLFDMKEVRNAGLFLDGCAIYLSGFSVEDREFLNKILNCGGATRYDDPSERVSHVIIAKPGGSDMELFKEKGLTPFFVSLEWILQSVKLKKLALEDDFIIKDAKSKTKTSGKPMQPGQVTHLDETRTEHLAELEQSKVLEMYKNASKPTSDMTETTMRSTTEEMTIKKYLNGVKFFLTDLDPENHRELETLIEDAGGTLVGSAPNADYIIAPELCSMEISPIGTCQLVSPLFIRSCIEKQDRVPVEYYHRPIVKSSQKPLTDLVFTVSSYIGLERYFIGELSKELGATFMDTMVRRNNPAKKLRATTHLICKQANGQKYNACLIWGLPGVSSDWLLECARTQTRVLEKDYLVGDTKCPERAFISVQNNASSTASCDSTPKRNLVLEKIIQNPMSSPRSSLKRMRRNSDENSLEENNINVPMNVSKMQTPLMNKHLGNVDKSRARSIDTPPPVQKVLEKLRGKESTQESPGLPPLPESLRTPDTPYGAFLWGPNPTPETRKRWKRFCDGLPSPETPMTPKTPSPTWSDVKREAWALLLRPANALKDKGTRLNFDEAPKPEIEHPQAPSVSSEDKPTTSPKSLIGVNTQVQKLNELLTSGGLGGNISNNRALTPISRKASLHNIDTINLDRAVKESQVESVGWRDPSEMESAKEHLESDSGLEEMQPFRKRPPRFLFSGVQSKEDLFERITALGGEICNPDSTQYDPTCSHILSDSIVRSEKILCGLASGKWILSTAYITHCLDEGRFVEEELFEWGNPESYVRSSAPNSDADACYRMRCMFNNKPVENKSEGAFSGWKVLVQVERKASMERVIRAGFGEVVNCRRIESLQEGQVTHCFCEPRKKTLSIDDTRHLIRIGVKVLPIQYLNLYVTCHPPPDPREHLITV